MNGDREPRGAEGESAQSAMRAPQETLAIVSHDIRAPLGVILGAVAELIDPRMGPITDEQRTLLGLVRRSGEKLSRLAANVQFLSRVAAGPLTLSRQSLDARDLVRRAVETFERSGELGKVKVAVQASAERVEMNAEPELAVHAIVNVLANAVRFARRQVTIAVTSDADGASIVVEDDGPGFMKELLPDLFDPRAPVRQPGKSTPRGLGLLVVKGILDAHGGAVFAETRHAAESALGARVREVFPRSSST